MKKVIVYISAVLVASSLAFTAPVAALAAPHPAATQPHHREPDRNSAPQRNVPPTRHEKHHSNSGALVAGGALFLLGVILGGQNANNASK